MPKQSSSPSFNITSARAVDAADIADLHARLGDTSKRSRAEYLGLQNTLKQDEFRAQEQRKKVEQLREKAEKAGVKVDQK